MIQRRFRFIRTVTLGCSLLLAGCGSSNPTADLEEKLERAEQAARRAELAQQAAESAAQKALSLARRSSSAAKDAPQVAEQTPEKNSLEPAPITPDNNLDNAGG